MSTMTVDELLEQLQKVPRPTKSSDNISYFTFTGTPEALHFDAVRSPTRPKPAGLDDNPPQAFHLYTMRQAIEEKFILDVLKGYVP